MTQPDEFDLSDRLKAMDADDPTRARQGRAGRVSSRGVRGPLLLLAVLAAALYLAVQAQDGEDASLATAEPEAWQGAGAGFETLTAPPTQPEPAADQAADPPAPPAGPSATEQALLDRLAGLQAQLDALRVDPSEDPTAAAQVAALGDLVEELRDEADRLRSEVREAERQRREAEASARDLAVDLAAAEAALVDTPAPLPPAVPVGLPAAEIDPGAARLAALAEQREAEAALREARVASPMIAFTGSVQAGEVAPVDLSSHEAFLQAGGQAAEVQQATVIAHPSRTVVQGTVIQAALETAIDSSLPGAIRALVSEDVHSFDGTRVLIPRGSRLVGRSEASADVAQRRLLVAWDRVVTPDGESLALSAVGADELGRAGVTGVVDRRLRTRFGSAALVSLISAVPQLASAALGDPVQADLAVDLAGDAQDAAISSLEPYLTLPPIIRVDQGARITVLVDRDLELP